MLIPEITLFAAGAALFLTLVNSLFVLWARLDMKKKFAEDRQMHRANNTAAYGLARHLRAIQKQIDAKPAASSNNTEFNFETADNIVDRGVDTLRLAEELDVSQNEAEIIAHLRPKRKALKLTA